MRSPAPVRTGADDPWGRSRFRARFGLRSRIAAAVAVVSAAGSLAADVLTYSLQVARVEARVDDALTAEIQEFEDFRALAVRVGLPAGSLEELFALADEGNIGNDDEAFVSLVDGAVVARSGADVALPPMNVDLVVGEAARAGEVRGQVELEPGTLRYAAVAVRVPGDPRVGTYLVLNDLGAQRAQAGQVAVTLAAVSLVTLLLVAGVGWLLANRVLEPVRLLAATADRITHTDLDERIPVSGTDEVAALARTVNDMLDRIQAGAVTQRRFLQEIGHELRTPLTVIGGHLDVVDRHDPDDVEGTVQLVQGEIERMARLVEDLRALADARSPELVRLGPVRVRDLVDAVVERAGALADRRWSGRTTVDAVVLTDEQRLVQACLQLAVNATRFTEPDDSITVEAGYVDGRLSILVADTGRGIAPEDQERVFQRFQRADEAAGGSGLGLPIVSAIAASLGGELALVGSAPGEGCTFELSVSCPLA